MKPVELKGAMILRNRRGIVSKEFDYALVMRRTPDITLLAIRILVCIVMVGGYVGLLRTMFGLLSGVRLFDVYRDAKRVGEGKKSMAYALTFRAPDRTLTGEEVEKAVEKLKKKVAGATGAEVRG